MRRTRLWGAMAAAVGAAAFAGIAVDGRIAATARPVARASQACPGSPGRRDPANPLALARSPGSDPLRGAHLWVGGPRYGPAAGAIAQLLGMNPDNFSDSYSWAQFQAAINRPPISTRLARDSGLRYQVHELSKVAAQPTPLRLSSYAHGGTPGGTEQEADKFFCDVLQSDPGSVPVINTYYAHPLTKSVCGSRSGMNRVVPLFHQFVDAMADATGNHPAVFMLELDALGSSGCFARGGTLGTWEEMLRYEVEKMAALPHTVVYLEGGYSDSNSAAYTASALKAIGLGTIKNFRGFFTDDTHYAWTINEVHWAERISRALHGVPYVVSTAQNGQGPIVPANRVKDGNEILCNPPRRGLGPRLTIAPGGPAPHADAYMWVVQPGNSDGDCNGDGGPSSGSFWPARAITLAALANARLGPGYPSRPY